MKLARALVVVLARYGSGGITDRAALRGCIRADSACSAGIVRCRILHAEACPTIPLGYEATNYAGV